MYEGYKPDRPPGQFLRTDEQFNDSNTYQRTHYHDVSNGSKHHDTHAHPDPLHNSRCLIPTAKKERLPNHQLCGGLLEGGPTILRLAALARFPLRRQPQPNCQARQRHGSTGCRRHSWQQMVRLCSRDRPRQWTQNPHSPERAAEVPAGSEVHLGDDAEWRGGGRPGQLEVGGGGEWQAVGPVVSG